MSQSDYRQQSHFYPPLQAEPSWSILANETFLEDENDNLPSRLFPEKSWSVLPSNDAEERRFLNINSSRNSPPAVPDSIPLGQSLPNLLSRETTTGMPEPEFQPSLASSAKEFLEETYKFERKRAEDFVGRPEEPDQNYDEQISGSTPRASQLFSPPQQPQELQQPQPDTAIFGLPTVIAIPVIGLAIAAYFLWFN